MGIDNNVQTTKNLAHDMLVSNNLNGAKELYKALCASDENDWNSWMMLGAVHGMLGELSEAEYCCRNAIHHNQLAVGAHTNLANVLVQQKRHDEANKYYMKALELEPDNAGTHNNIGNLHYIQGRYLEAEKYYREAIRLQPRYPDALTNLGLVLHKQGRIKESIKYHNMAINIDQNSAIAHYNIGCALEDSGEFKMAEGYLSTASNLDPTNEDVYIHLSTVLTEQNKIDDALKCCNLLIKHNPGNLDAYIHLGTLFQKKGMADEAIESLKCAINIDPNCEAARDRLCNLYSSIIPSWHFPMMNDSERNDAYDNAISKVIDENTTVLDIGSGSGLLAMMAARAGARQVTTCEVIKTIAEKANEIIKLNKLDSIITVINKKSTALEVGSDIDCKANVLISEILDAGLLGEMVIPVVKHARKSLLTENATIIPSRATVFFALVDSVTLYNSQRVGTVSGFDLSPFNEFSRKSYCQIALHNYPFVLLTNEIESFTFDFCGPDIYPEEKVISLTATHNGYCHAIAFWYQLWLDDAIFIETHPDNKKTCWKQAVQFLEKPVFISKGTELNIIATHDCASIYFKIIQ